MYRDAPMADSAFSIKTSLTAVQECSDGVLVNVKSAAAASEDGVSTVV